MQRLTWLFPLHSTSNHPSAGIAKAQRAWQPLKHFGILWLVVCKAFSHQILPAFSVTLPQREAAWKSAKSLMAGWGLSGVVTFFQAKAWYPQCHCILWSLYMTYLDLSWHYWTWYDLSGNLIESLLVLPTMPVEAPSISSQYLKQWKSQVARQAPQVAVCMCSWGCLTNSIILISFCLI